MRLRLNFKGDTLIEVMLAMTLLSAILFTSWALVNRSTQISLAARQRIVVVNQLKEQAEIIKSIYAKETLRPTAVETFTFGSTSPAKSPTLLANVHATPCDSTRSDAGVTNGKNPIGGFHFDQNAVVSTTNVPKSMTEYENAKVWVQMVSGSGYIDFHIRGCWQTTGGQQQEDSAFIIMRLNTT